MADLARPMVSTTLEEVPASMTTGLLWVTQDGAGKMCTRSSSRYGYPQTRFDKFTDSQYLYPPAGYMRRLFPDAYSCPIYFTLWTIFRPSSVLQDWVSEYHVLTHIRRALTLMSPRMRNMPRPTDLTRPSRPMKPTLMGTDLFSSVTKATLPTRMSASCVLWKQ